MSYKILLVVFIVTFVLEFAAFGMQRATLLLSREASIPYQHAAALLPKWFPVVWLLRVIKWGVLIYIATSLSWWFALALFIGDFLLSAILPIPYNLYAPTFRKRINQIKCENEAAGEYLEQIFHSSQLNGN